MANQQKREQWGCRLGVIMAVIGSAVGLGNFLRFPGQAAMHGGGAYMIPYFLTMVLLAIPLGWLEWAMGRYGGSKGFSSVPGIFMAVTKRKNGAWCGLPAMFCCYVIYTYYIIVEALCLIFAYRYLLGYFGLLHYPTQEDFALLMGASENGVLFQTSLFSEIMVAVFACYAMNFYLIYRGISKGIERFCLWAMPLLVICGLILLFRVMFLGNPTGIEGQSYLDGLGFIWNPTQPGKTFFESLSDPATWLAAAGQVFFSYSLGFGLVITYASYMKKDDDVVLSSLTAVAGNGWCEIVIGGMMVVPVAVMFLGPEAFGSLGSSFSLGFIALPSVFDSMAAGWFFGFLFFFLLFLAATTSSISILQPPIVLIEESLGIGRKRSVTILWFLTFIGSCFILYFSKGLTALDTFDFWGAELVVFVMATIQIIIFGWVFGIDRGMREIRRGAEIRIPRGIGFLIKYVLPAYLLTIFMTWLYYELPNRVRELRENTTVQLSVGFLFLIALFLAFLLATGLQRWRNQGRISASGDFVEKPYE
ncbi:MAG: sodium-dependent transporter [Planctomycetaceae bacterium]|nr:sodium-dependent transporter [Planctomycetaceae bacterium]